MVGIVASATLLYPFPGFAGYDSMLAERSPTELARLQVHLRKPRAQWMVAPWAFLPVVPPDLICCAAGLVRMPSARMILGVVIGEIPPVTLYVLAGREAVEMLPL